MEEWLTIAQASKELKVSGSRVSQLVSSGVLDSKLEEGRRLIARTSVEWYAGQARKVGRPAKPHGPAIEFVLMNADYPVMRFAYDSSAADPLTPLEVLDAARCPWGTVTRGGKGKATQLNGWWRKRSVSGERSDLEHKLTGLNVSDTTEIPFRSFGLSLSDCYWVLMDDMAGLIGWKDVNYLANDPEQGTASQDGYWSAAVGLNSPDNTTAGITPKRWITRGGKRALVKQSGVAGALPFNELVASKLHERIFSEGEFVAYEKLTVPSDAAQPAVVSERFLKANEEFIPFGQVFQPAASEAGHVLYERFCNQVARLGIGEDAVRAFAAKLVVSDALLANAGRHWNNIGLIRNIDTLEVRLAPLFGTDACLASEGDDAWAFAGGPFALDPLEQVACVDRLQWFDPAELADFPDVVRETLAGAVEPERLGVAAAQVQERLETLTQYARVAKYRLG